MVGAAAAVPQTWHLLACAQPPTCAHMATNPTAAPSWRQNSNVGGYNSRGFVEVLAASQTTTTKEWFQARLGRRSMQEHVACCAL